VNVSVTGSGVSVSVTGGGPIQASAASQSPIAVSAAQSSPQAATIMQASPVAATVTGGMGPPGTPNRLVDLTDTDVASAAPGDVLRYDGTKWRGRAETQLVDGGNW
jgi:hypothetical protein